MNLINRFKQTYSDITIISDRNLLRYLRVPQLVVFSTIQPVIFLLLFAYVFGGAIKVPGFDYINFLIPGIFIQTAIFGSMMTGVGLADDLSQGMIDRFRSLPIARSAVLAGRIIADTIRNTFVLILMTGVGYLIGFRFGGNVGTAVLSLLIALFLGFAFSWIAAAIGLAVKNTETAQVAGFIWVFPLMFASSLFVPIETMPKMLKAAAGVSPITLAVDAVRALALQGKLTNDLWFAMLWLAGIFLVFVPLSVYLYRKNT
ncbi:MAG: ABC transporter permease [Candidatus Doudnabacteria bacterium]|nr:ABC transporter permease [Candidatus Doudnabacteria bacterium]